MESNEYPAFLEGVAGVFEMEESPVISSFFFFHTLVFVFNASKKSPHAIHQRLRTLSPGTRDRNRLLLPP